MRYLDLLEQIELVEAAKDKYAPMFAFIKQFEPVLDNPRSYSGSAIDEIAWATGALRNSDRVIWYLRLVKLNILHSVMEEMKFRIRHSNEQDVPGLVVGSVGNDWENKVFYSWYANESKVYADQKGIDPRKLAWENLPVSRKKAALVSFAKTTRNAIPADLWAETMDDAGVAAAREALKVAETLFNKERNKMTQKALREATAEAEKYKTIANPLAQKLTDMKALCGQQPDHEDCGNTMEELENRWALYNTLWSIARSAVDEIKQAVRNDSFLRISGYRGDLAHFESINYEPMNDYQFGWKPVTLVKGALGAFEEHWASRAKRILSHDEDDYKGIEKVLEFENGWAWWNLHRPHCEREGKAMGHCGNDYENMRPEDEVLSLREPMGTTDDKGHEEWKPHLTFIFDTKKGTLSEMKGFKNNKPEAKYHHYIVPLLQQEWVNGIALRVHQHEKANNFFVSDLDKDTALKLIQEKPGLLTKVDRDSMDLEMELPDFGEGVQNIEQINEMLNEWSIEQIEEDDEYDANVYILSVWKDEQDIYESLSGGSWPDEDSADYPEPDVRNMIYDNLSAHVLAKFIQYVAIEYPEEAMDKAGLDPEDEAYTLEDVANDLDFSDALNILENDYGSNPMEDEVDEAWKKIIGDAMKYEASQAVGEVENWSSGNTNMPDGREYGNIVNQSDGRIFLEIDKEEFMNDVYPQLENLEHHGGSYTKDWAYILGFNIYDVTDSFYENMDRESYKYYTRDAAGVAESAIDTELTNYIRAYGNSFNEWAAKRHAELHDEDEEPYEKYIGKEEE